jgi:hypothetical protein
MLKKLTATGIAAAGITGGILLAGPANAESLTVKHNGCYDAYCNQPGYQLPGYQNPGYQNPGYQQPGYENPGNHYGWGRGHHNHPWNGYRSY